MRFALMIEAQQGCSYADQLALAQHAEAAGFETFLRSDHYDSFPGEAGRPTTDTWAVLAGLARETSRIRLGALVSPVTFRHPGNLAKLATTVDEMSGGRLDVGVGAGWNQEEHDHHGFPFPPIEVRAEMLEEQLEIPGQEVLEHEPLAAGRLEPRGHRVGFVGRAVDPARPSRLEPGRPLIGHPERVEDRPRPALHLGSIAPDEGANHRGVTERGGVAAGIPRHRVEHREALDGPLG